MTEHTWAGVVRILSNQGGVLFSLKKVKEYADSCLMNKGYLKLARKFSKGLEFNPNQSLTS